VHCGAYADYALLGAAQQRIKDSRGKLVNQLPVFPAFYAASAVTGGAILCTSGNLLGVRENQRISPFFGTFSSEFKQKRQLPECLKELLTANSRNDYRMIANKRTVKKMLLEKGHGGNGWIVG
jgi:hypothetical protein